MQPKIDKITINLDTKLSSKFVSWAEIKKFFPHKEVRDGQKQVIRVLVTVLKKVKYKHKYDDIIVCAPTGLGKSSIVVTVANFFAKQGLKSSILMQRKGLIDQYAISYDIPIMKGRNNYECIHDRDLCKRCGLCDDSNCSADVAPCEIGRAHV